MYNVTLYGHRYESGRPSAVRPVVLLTEHDRKRHAHHWRKTMLFAQMYGAGTNDIAALGARQGRSEVAHPPLTFPIKH